MFATKLAWTAFFRSLAFGLLIALTFAGAHAETFRLPRQGVPAFVVDAPPGWNGVYAQENNLTFTAADLSAVVQFSMITSDELATTAPEAMAAFLFQSTGAPPYQRSESGSIAGYAGTAFVGTLPANGVTLDMRVVLAKFDATHYLCVSRLTRKEITADQRATMDVLIARASVAAN